MARIRKLVLVTCVMASAGLAGLTTPAQGTAPLNGYGFGISDDGGPDTLNTQYFDRLRPKSFRFMVPWYAIMDPGEVARANAIIFTARARGVDQITVTFRNSDQLPGRPWANDYAAAVGAFVQQYAGVVDAWGPANEPNCKNGGWSALNDTVGAQFTADYYRRLLFVVRAHDPTAIMMSPDFCDNYDGTSLQPWMSVYTNAGGGFGDVIAWHPYWDIHHKGAARVPGPGGTPISSTQNLINNVNNNPIWVTEGGAFYANPGRNIPPDEQRQNDRVRWMVDTLANHPRIQRLHYYSMFGNRGGFDTGLLWPDHTRRLSWYTWCWYSHNLNGFHPDC